MDTDLLSIAKGMSDIACNEKWYAIYLHPLTSEGPQVDQIIAVHRDPDGAQDYLNELEKKSRLRGYVSPIKISFPAYVPSLHPAVA